LLVVRVVTVVVSAAMATLFSDVLNVAMIAAMFSRRSGYTGRPRRRFSLDVLRAYHRCLLFSYSFFFKILAIFRRVRKIAKSDY